MNIAPLEYLVISLPDHHSLSEIVPELAKIKEKGLIRVVDLLFLSKDANGTVTVSEVSEQSAEELVAYQGLSEDLIGLLTEADIEQLAANLPSNTEAVVLLLEHSWVLGLTEALRQAGGTLIIGGLVGPAELTQLNAELAEKEEQYA